MASLAQIREELQVKRDNLHLIFEEAGPEMDLSRVTRLDGDTHSKAAEIKRLNTELTELGVEKDRLEAIEIIAQNNASEYKRLSQPQGEMLFPGGSGGNRGGEAASMFGSGRGQGTAEHGGLKNWLLAHKAYRDFRDNRAREVNIEMPGMDFKTLVTLATISPQTLRRPVDPVNLALEERTVSDLMLQGAVDRGTVEYYEETTFTNNATTVAEGAAKPESALGYTLRTEPVRKIGHFIPATKEALDDVAFLESQIRGRLAFGVRRIEEAQLLSGDGNAPNLQGLLNRSGIQTQAKGADPTPDAVYRAMQKIRGASGAGFAEPSAVVMHPNDWTDIKLLRTADGIYIWGNPSDEGPDRIWGLPVRQTTGITEGTGLVGAFRPHAEVLRREGITITLSTEHASYFIENKVAILAEERIGLAVYRPSAFCTVTGI